jgi:ribosome-binding protein aMBF1 (putative translation factor)
MEATGAQRYFDARAERSSEYRDALADARSCVATIDRVVRALDDRRQALGLSKAELARRAGMRPEVVRRLLSADSTNPTLATVVSLASVLSLDITLSAPASVSGGQSAVSGTPRRTA